MKIMTPLNSLESLDPLARAGADEFYIGFYDRKWEQAFGGYADINRMSGFGQAANRYSFEEIFYVAEAAQRAQRSLYVTLNANVYRADQIAFICEHYLPGFASAGVSGVIVSDEMTAKAVRAYGIDPVASTMCGIYNTDIAAEYEESGIRRMILPRDLSLQEIEEITTRLPHIDFEVFHMRNGCIFSDSHCLGMHRKEYGGICSTLAHSHRQFVQKNSDFHNRHSLYLTDYLYHNFLHRNACGLCALYRMNKMNIKSLKIVGRADSAHKICRDVELTKYNIQVAKQSISEEAYLSRMRFPENSKHLCMLGFSCYYPEIRF